MDKTPNVRVFLVVRDGRNEAKSTQNIIGRMNVVYDEKGEVFSHFGVEAPYGKNDNSTVVLLDSNEKIALVDTAYRAQGEHLKPLESKLKALNGIDATVSTAPASKPLKVGDIAPNFLVHGGQTLRDLRGKVVLVSFYPAAFSGSFPKPYDVAPAEAGKRASEQTASTPAGISAAPLPQGVTKTASGSYIIDGRSVDMKSLISCSYQILELDKQPADPIKTAKRILVSSSTPPLLEQWRSALNTSNIIYANDPDYWISKQYLSYNPAGYNNRVSVIVDQTGKIAYIDDSFDTPDEPVIEGKIKELLDKDKKHSGR
jgi:peroxiredoxin